MAKNPWMSASLSAANRAYYTAAGSAAAQARAAAGAQQAQLRRDMSSAQRDMTNAWLDLWMPTGRQASTPASGARKRTGGGTGSRRRKGR